MKKNKYIMISLSVILVSLILLVPNNKVEAREIEYNGATYNTDTMYQSIVNQIGSSNTNLRTSYYQIAFENDNKLYFVLFPISGASCLKLDSKTLSTCSGSNVVENEDLALKFSLGSSGYGISTYNQAFAYIVDSVNFTEEIKHYTRTNSSSIVFASDEEVSNYTAEELLNNKVLYSNFNLYFTSDNIDIYVRPFDRDVPYFEKTYSSSDYSKIEVDFKVPTDGSTYFFDFNLLIDSLNNVSVPYFHYQYIVLHYDEDNNLSAEGNFDEFVYISDMSSNHYEYINSLKIFPNPIDEGDKSYGIIKLVIPLDTDFGGDVYVKFESNLEFEVTEYTNEDFSYNFTALDLTNKKGAILVAKDIENTYSANFKVQGSFYLEFRDSLSDNNYNVEKVYTYGFCDVLLEESDKYNCSLSDKFSYFFGAENPYRVLHFRNLNSDKNITSVVYYDSDKFDVYVIENDTVNIIIKDPVSGDDVIFNNSIYEQYSQAEVDIDYLINLIENFLDNNDNSVELVRRILLLFFSQMPVEIYQALILLLFVMFICAVIMIAGWK